MDLNMDTCVVISLAGEGLVLMDRVNMHSVSMLHSYRVARVLVGLGGRSLQHRVTIPAGVYHNAIYRICRLQVLELLRHFQNFSIHGF